MNIYTHPMRRVLVIATLFLATIAASAQWDIQDSGTKASLRGIHSLGKGIAWASGSDGTVLRTEDGGYLWQHCTMPPGAEKLDFRGVQGFDANTAIVMSSGKGDLSRLYRTTDGCQTWILLMTNDDPDGFWDALRMWTPTDGFLAGDPVNGFLYFAESTSWWNNFLDQGEDPLWKVKGPGEAAFAASNSSLALGTFGTKDGDAREVWFATGGTEGSRVFHYRHFNGGEPERQSLAISKVDFFPKSASAGIFALNFRNGGVGIAVGGDYLKPTESSDTAAFAGNDDIWLPAKTFPHGYRSSVAYDSKSKTWITVGPNGTDISTDDGRNWHALKPGPNDASDADKNWNALSLPFVVGPKGRIGVLRPDALKAAH